MNNVQLPYELTDEIAKFIASTGKFKYNHVPFSKVNDMYVGHMDVDGADLDVTKIRVTWPSFEEVKVTIEGKFPGIVVYKPDSEGNEYGLLPRQFVATMRRANSIEDIAIWLETARDPDHPRYFLFGGAGGVDRSNDFKIMETRGVPFIRLPDSSFTPYDKVIPALSRRFDVDNIEIQRAGGYYVIALKRDSPPEQASKGCPPEKPIHVTNPNVKGDEYCRAKPTPRTPKAHRYSLWYEVYISPTEFEWGRQDYMETTVAKATEQLERWLSMTFPNKPNRYYAMNVDGEPLPPDQQRRTENSWNPDWHKYVFAFDGRYSGGITKDTKVLLAESEEAATAAVNAWFDEVKWNKLPTRYKLILIDGQSVERGYTGLERLGLG